MEESKSNRVRYAPLIVIVLAIIGVGFTELFVEQSVYYWGVSCFLFAILSSVQANKHSDSAHILQHILHWGGALLALALVYLFVLEGQLNASQSGLVSVVILALALFTDGIRVNSRYAMVGIYLFITAGVMGYIESFIWWFVLLSCVVIGFEVHWLRKAQKRN